MLHTMPVAGAIVDHPPHADPLVVEADPTSETTRCFKGIARYLYRFIQELRWSDHGGAVFVGIGGDGPSAALVAPNVATLLAPLLTVCVVEDDGSLPPSAVFEVDPQDVAGDEPPNPRDRVWIARADSFGHHIEADRFELVIGRQHVLGSIRPSEMCMVVVAGSPVCVPESLLTCPEAAIVLDQWPDPDHPETTEVTVV